MDATITEHLAKTPAEQVAEKTAYFTERFERYRANGEDWGTANEWATQDVESKFGRL